MAGAARNTMVQQRTVRCLDGDGNRSGLLRGAVGLLTFKRDEFLFLQMCSDFLQRGPTLKIELQHLPGSLGRLTSRPQDDEQAGDQGGVDLQGNAVLRCRQELAYSQGRISASGKTVPPSTGNDIPERPVRRAGPACW